MNVRPEDKDTYTLLLKDLRQRAEMLVNQQGYTRYRDKTAAAPFLYSSATQTFITYNDAEAETDRTRYVKQHHLDGIMFWQYTGNPRNTLLNAIDEGFGISTR